MAPPLETYWFGYTISWNILLPGLIIPGLVFTPMALWPWIERWITGDDREHHLLDRPRNAPTRTAIGAAVMMFMFVALINGGNDLIATHFDSSINHIMWFTRIGIIVLPILTFFITKRVCLSLQRADRDLVLHGRETGRLVRLPHGEFVEIHEPLSKEELWKLTSHEQLGALEVPESDANGVRRPRALQAKLRERWSKANAEQIAKPTAKELENEAHH
jgi:ubiquinol-cytochrome c reductase cytochrome b subunit